MRTVQVKPDEMKKRVFRWEGSEPITRHDDFPRELKLDVVAENIHGVITSTDPDRREEESNLFDTAPIQSGVQNFAMSLLSCPPNQGPCLHVHHFTYETFTVLEGEWRFNWNDDGEHSVILKKWDTVSFPPGVQRRFENISDTRSYMQVIVYGEGKITDDISLSPAVREYLVGRHGEEKVSKMGTKFTATVD